MRSVEATDTSPFGGETETQECENNFHRVCAISAWLTCSTLTVHVICRQTLVPKMLQCYLHSAFRNCQNYQENPMSVSTVFHNSTSWDIETMRTTWDLKYTQDTTTYNKSFVFTQWNHDLHHNVVYVMERVRKCIKNYKQKNIFSLKYTYPHLIDNYILFKKDIY